MISGTLLSALASFLVSFLSTVVRDLISDLRRDQGLQDLGAAKERERQAADALTDSRAMAEIAARQDTEADVLGRLERGSG